jgi:hypothetical protein
MRPLSDGFHRSPLILRLQTLAIALIAGCNLSAFAEPEPLPPITHVHAHNDYEHTHPLFDALSHGITSVEADIHLVNGQLLVAHDLKQVQPTRTLQSLYLDPLRARTEKFGGHIYPNGDPTFYLLIDFKSDPNLMYPVLRKVLEQYADLLTTFSSDKVERKAITVVLTGNRPRQLLRQEPVRLAALDAIWGDLATPQPKNLYLWMSEDWKQYFQWNGDGAFPPEEKARLLDMVKKSHRQHLLVRFWDAPDTPRFWKELRRDGVDLLNADDLPGVEKFLRAEVKN